MNEIRIGNKVIGKNAPLYFIADIGANHDGDLNRALRLIELAKEAGADAAKFQNFKAKKIVSKEGFESLGGQLSHQAKWKKSVFETYEDASVSDDWTSILKKKCDEVGIDYFTSAYDFDSVDHAFDYVDVYKIGSGDITWTDIIAYTADKGKPVMIATGASDMSDVERAMDILLKRDIGVVLMQCNTNYTVDPDKYKYVNLNVLKKYGEAYPDVVLGLSDHTFGHATVLGAIALGARVFEKHFTDDNSRVGPDHTFAMNPKTWKEMVDNANQCYSALGDGVKRVEDNEQQAGVVQRRGLRFTRNMKPGEIISKEDLEALRPIPEDGIPPYRIDEFIGKTMSQKANRGSHLSLSHIKSA
jgi:N-acetylneuraminate synthase